MLEPTHVRARLQARDQRLAELGFDSYGEYMISPAWRAVKARYRAAGFALRCFCGATTKVQMHHLTYVRVGGDEQLEDLMPLCHKCHQMVHALERRGDIDLALSGLTLDEQRATAHRAHASAEALRREMKRAAFNELPLDERIRRLRVANAKHGSLVSRDLHVIERQVARAEAKTPSVRGQATLVAAIERQSRRVEEKLNTRAPHALNTLMPETPDVASPSTLAAPACDNSMTCDCPRCADERMQAIVRGVRPRHTEANPLRAIDRPGKPANTSQDRA